MGKWRAVSEPLSLKELIAEFGRFWRKIREFQWGLGCGDAELGGGRRSAEWG